MKRNFLLLLILFILCAPVFSEDKKDDGMRGVNYKEISGARLLVGVNEVAGSMAEPSWPIIVTVSVFSEEEPPPALPDNLQVKVENENGDTVAVNFEPVVRSTADQDVRYWIASTQDLTPGRYHISVEPVQGFIIESGDLVILEPANEHSAVAGLLHVQRLLLLGKDTEAMQETERLTTEDPQNADAWIAKGDLLLAQDLPDEAIKAYDEALAILEKAEEESLSLEERRRAAFFRSLEKRGVLTTTGTQ